MHAHEAGFGLCRASGGGAGCVLRADQAAGRVGGARLPRGHESPGAPLLPPAAAVRTLLIELVCLLLSHISMSMGLNKRWTRQISSHIGSCFCTDMPVSKKRFCLQSILDPKTFSW